MGILIKEFVAPTADECAYNAASFIVNEQYRGDMWKPLGGVFPIEYQEVDRGEDTTVAEPSSWMAMAILVGKIKEIH